MTQSSKVLIDCLHPNIVMPQNRSQQRLKPLDSIVVPLLNVFTEDILELDDDTPSVDNDKEINVVLNRLGWLNCWYLYVVSMVTWDLSTCQLSMVFKHFCYLFIFSLSQESIRSRCHVPAGPIQSRSKHCGSVPR